MPVRNGLLLYELRRSNCLPESIATGPALLGPLRSQRCLADARRNPPSEVLILFYSGEKKPVFADRFLKYGRRERITRPCGTRPSGRCVRNVVSLTPGATLLRRCSSSFIQAKKNLSLQTGFLNMVGERGFEPPTHWSQTSCATKLRYSPMGAHVTAPPRKRQPLFALSRPIAWKAGGQRVLCLAAKNCLTAIALLTLSRQVPDTSY